MAHTTIQQDIELFHKTLLDAQQDLDAFTSACNARLDGVSAELDKLPALAQGLKLAEDEPAAALVNGEVDTWTTQLSACARAAHETIMGQAFQHRFQKQPLVVVFGPVKAGKSTLGNFILGKAFRTAPFNNPYRSGTIPKPEIIVEESGRVDTKTKEWFDVNSIESTCSAQYFSIPGLVWVDTPGYGAVEKKKLDIRPLADIARQYVKYADLVIFLDNSEEPWQQDVNDAFKAVYMSGKKVLSALLRSDVVGDEDVVDGKIVTPLVAKSAADRAAQERYVRNGMRKCGAISADCDVISVSVKLAEEAVNQADEAKWEASGMGLFYRKISEVLGNGHTRDLKKEAPRQLLNGAIQEVGGLVKSLTGGLISVRGKLQEKHKFLCPEGELVQNIVEEVVDDLRASIRRVVDLSISRSEASDIEEVPVSLDSLREKIVQTTNGVIEASIRRIIGDYRKSARKVFNPPSIQTGLTRETCTISYTVSEPTWVPRAPRGLWENIRSFFGKKYRICETTVSRHCQEINLGFNATQARQTLIGQFSSAVTDHVRTELADFREAFFASAIKKIDILLNRVHQAEKDLSKSL